MEEIAKRYTSGDIEGKWYKHWLDQKYFRSMPDEREPFTIVIPPPNVTGILHMGHILNNTIQDILIRKARMEGKNACWVPGMDHASIATEAKVVQLLREKGIKKSDLTREEFMEYAWAWKEKYGGIILDQLKRLGASCDWDRTAFTMDEVRSHAVYKVFIDLFKKGKLYRGLRMVNWDPVAKTVLSNEEVIYKEEESNLYYVIYKVIDEDGGETGEFLQIATTRPETILGDTAVAVHPEDERYIHLKGKFVLVPMIERKVPIIFDDYVDREFGTGALKITPAHDPNDYEIGQRHGLETIDVLNDDATISEAGGMFIGMDRDEARIEAKKELKKLDQLVKIERLTHNVGRSERTSCIVEPKLSLQWFVDMKSLSTPALEAVESGDIVFFPENQKNTYRHWMGNIRDWCISRQLWWGHQIPAYYITIEGNEHVFVDTDVEGALKQAKEKLGNHISLEDLNRDEDVLDTWFSSWLWPISVFDGFESQKEIDYYYPTNVLVTGWDIIFLWVARMAMAGFEWKNEKPFNHVYFTGMVRDPQRRKMSKSLGNSPDALKLIDDFGADGVRFGIMYSSPVGGDLLFDESHCEQGRNFSNKIWNALRLIKGWKVEHSEQSAQNALACAWFEELSQQVVAEVRQKMDQYRLSEALVLLYKYIWGDFCSSFLEMIKPPFVSGDDGENYQLALDESTYRSAINFYGRICILLHPFMPFITEEVWNVLKDRKKGDDCMIQAYPVEKGKIDLELIGHIETLLEVKTKILEIRNNNQIPFKQAIDFGRVGLGEVELWKLKGAEDLLAKLTNIKSFSIEENTPSQAFSFIIDNTTYFVISEVEIDIEGELSKLHDDLEYQRGFLNSVDKKLSNERFVAGAPEAVVAIERKKREDSLIKIEQLEQSIEELKLQL